MGSGINGPYTGTRGSVNHNDGLKKELMTNLAETLIEVLNKKNIRKSAIYKTNAKL